MGHPSWREDTDGWKKQLERGLPLETRKQRGRRLAKERQNAARIKRHLDSSHNALIRASLSGEYR